MDKTRIRQEIRQALLKERVKLAYLYGSFVTGKVRRGRDIDVAVVAGKNQNLNEAKISLAIQKQLGAGRPEADVRLIDINSPAVFLRNILTGGEPMVVRDNAGRIEFEVRAMKNYYDSEYLRRFMTKNMYQNIKTGSYGRRQSHH